MRPPLQSAFWLTLSAALVVLSGCAVGPNYRPPQTSVSTGFANGNPTAFSSNQTTIAWWRGFSDAKLDRLVDLAVATNQDLRIASARVREARALRTGTILSAFPIAHGNAGYTKSLSSKDSVRFVQIPRSARELQLYDAGFDATWELDFFGAARRAIEASSADVAATEESRRDVLISLIAEVARNYFELRGIQMQLEVNRKNATNQQETLEIAEAKLRAGTAAELDVARTRSQLSATLAGIPPLDAAIKHNIHRIGVLTGRPPAALEPELISPAPLPSLPALVNIGSPADMLRRRPDIRTAERALAAATARVGVATADLFPHVTFNGRFALQAGEISGIGKSGSDSYSFGPRLTWAAFDINRVRAQIKAAGARTEAALAFYERTVLGALEETENALVDFGREQARRDHLQAAMRAAEDGVVLSRDRYQKGIADFLSVLDAERTQLSIEDQLAQSETRTVTALVAVYKALGGGWEIEGRPASTALMNP